MNRSRWYGPLVRTSDWAWRILVILALVALLVWLGIVLAAIVVPALLAVVLIPVGRPLVQKLEQRMPAALAAVLVLLLALVILGLASWLMLASIAGSWDQIRQGMSDAAAAIGDWIEAQVGSLDGTQIATIEQNLDDLVGSVSSVLVGGAARGVMAIGSLLVGLFFFVVILFFGLRDWDQFKRLVVRNTAVGARPKMDLFLERNDVVLRNFWKGQALIGVFDAVALGLGLWLIGVPLVLPIAILTFVISFIPYLGAVISSALAVFVALGTQGPGAAWLALLLSLVVFNTGENLMRPWLVGETIKLPTFVVFMASTVGVLLAGALGAVLAIPLVAMMLEAQRIFVGPGDPQPD